jgi:GABA(A) receptor-associated protein
MDFKKEHTLEQRKIESAKVIDKYTDRFPVIVSRHKTSKLKNIDKYKFLVPSNLTLGQFLYIIRKRIELNEQEALFVFINETILAKTSDEFGSLYESHKDEDGFLYLSYCSENVFG